MVAYQMNMVIMINYIKRKQINIILWQKLGKMMRVKTKDINIYWNYQTKKKHS